MNEPKYTDDGLPIIPPLPKQPEPSRDGAIAQCGECGMRIMPVMGYVCQNARCPIMPRVTCSASGVVGALPVKITGIRKIEPPTAEDLENTNAN